MSAESKFRAFPCSGCMMIDYEPNGVYILHPITQDGSTDQKEIGFLNESQLLKYKNLGRVEESLSSSICPECWAVGDNISLEALKIKVPEFKSYIELYQKYRSKYPKPEKFIAVL